MLSKSNINPNQKRLPGWKVQEKVETKSNPNPNPKRLPGWKTENTQNT